MLGISYGRIGEMEGVWKSFMLITVIKNEIDAVLNKDPRNDVAHHVLGIFYRKVPWLMGGSLQKSILYLKQAIAENPFRTRHYLELAKSVFQQGKKEEALRHLHRLLAISNPEDPVQTKYDREDAEALLLRLQSKNEGDGQTKSITKNE